MKIFLTFLSIIRIILNESTEFGPLALRDTTPAASARLGCDRDESSSVVPTWPDSSSRSDHDAMRKLHQLSHCGVSRCRSSSFSFGHLHGKIGKSELEANSRDLMPGTFVQFQIFEATE